jgi:hypothetical protein
MENFKIADYEYGVYCIWMGICLGVSVIAVFLNPVYLMVDSTYGGCCSVVAG